ncbi:hypothetical protein BDW02DRAFT_359153 [Decorospora gaudefroyi]|uniref:F-box domain-containing protein n=1 Tax=Decorospora gaudefroyi TaxID=184978 RepID=A0A6A5KEJ0_9PLEO|nr:hypothetical protein BDW02DRAFT_359153 [Decorospora gaudefroyi]
MATRIPAPAPTSPLLGLPAEVRNNIYRNLYKHSGAILLVPSSSNYARVSPLVHAVPDIDVLTTCRQFFDEASSVFYTDNTFLLSTLSDANNDAANLGFLEEWLTSLGTRRHLVRNVLIDLSPLCPVPCHNAHRFIDLLPIMLQIWRLNTAPANPLNPPQRYANIRISFALSGRLLHSHAHPPHPVPSAKRVINIAALNDMIASLSPGSQPVMRPYFCSPRTIDQIRTRIDGRQVRFLLSTPHHLGVSDMGRIDFTLDNTNQLVKSAVIPAKDTGIDKLINAATVRETLLKLLMEFNVEELTYDMDTLTISKRYPEVFSINRHIRGLALERYGSVHVIAKVTAQEPKASFSNLAAMKNWFTSTRGVTERVYQGSGDEPTLLIRFNLPGKKDLAQLRISIRDAIFATLDLQADSELRVELAYPGAEVLVYMRTLVEVQRELLVFLTGLMDGDPSRKAGACPEIWMDGYCRITEAEFAGEGGAALSVSNEKYDWDEEGLEEEHGVCVSQLIEDDDSDTVGDEGSLHARAMELASMSNTLIENTCDQSLCKDMHIAPKNKDSSS